MIALVIEGMAEGKIGQGRSKYIEQIVRDVSGSIYRKMKRMMQDYIFFKLIHIMLN